MAALLEDVPLLLVTILSNQWCRLHSSQVILANGGLDLEDPPSLSCNMFLPNACVASCKKHLPCTPK
jgi:hypothetical protein